MARMGKNQYYTRKCPVCREKITITINEGYERTFEHDAEGPDAEIGDGVNDCCFDLSSETLFELVEEGTYGA